MLEQTKQVLTQVSFDSKLFFKELIKGIKALSGTEAIDLKLWCIDNFKHQYADEISYAFYEQTV